MKRWIIFVIFISTFEPSIAYCLKNSDDLIVSSQALYLLSIATSCNNDFLCLIFKENQLEKVFFKLEQLIERSKCE